MNRDNAFIIAALSFIPSAPEVDRSLLPSPPPCYPFLFTLFCPQRIHCRCRVVGGYRQPVGISVSTRARVGGWMSFVKVPSLLFSPALLPGVSPPLPSEPGFRPALHRGQPRCRQAFKRQGRFLFLPRRFLAAIMCALLLRLRMTRAQGRGMSTGSLVESRRATDKVVSVERRRRRRRRVAFDSNSLSQYLPPFPPPVHPCFTVSLCSQSRFRRRYYFLL